jgi:hypothetical protein
MKKTLQQNPLFVILLPVFFVFHGFVENCYFIRFMDTWSLLAIYTGAAAILYGLSWLLLKDRIRAALLSSYIMGFYFFFGALHDFLRQHSIFLHRYSILLPTFLIGTIGLIFYLRKKTSRFARITFFLNILFTTYLLADGVIWAWKSGRKTSTDYTDSQVMAGRYGTQFFCDTCVRPDIYLLIFDEYSATRTLKEQYHYDNSRLDSFLTTEGFHIQQQSRSNYFITPFSMASMLNFSYLKNIPHPMDLQPGDYTDICEPIRKNEAVNFLLSRGYSIINNSPFDLPGHPSLLDLPFIPVKTKLITRRTLTDYIIRDMGPWLADHLDNHDHLVETGISRTQRMNDTFLAGTEEESGRRSATPRFIYTHVLMPHFPYIFDSSMHKRSHEELVNAMTEFKPGHYLEYLPYTNARIRELITTIKRNSGGRAVILFMSDHGWRYAPDNIDRPHFFNNQNAVYFPDGDYSLLYDSISNVNQFRVVFNKLFHLKLPLLRDSILFLHDHR